MIVTNDREMAKSYIAQGYILFTVPQMFGDEQGVITLVKGKGYDASHVSNEDAERVLADYEADSRENVGRWQE